jgi:fluoride exporter
MVHWMLVFVGGGLGSMLRYAFSLYIAPFSYASRFFPLATLLANIVSCFILGLLINKYVHDGLSTDARLLFATGFCGGFSTFSTLSLEMLRMIESGQVGTAFLYIALTTLTGLAFLYFGYKLSI